jgi:hypothetical protein
MEHPLKVAMPPVVVDVQFDSTPGPDPIAIVMGSVSVVTVLPPASSIVTTGWMPKGLPATASPGCVVKTSWAGAPTVTANVPLGALNVSPVSLAVSTSPVFATSIVQPLKAATPAVVVDVHPDRVPLPVVSARVTPSVSEVTVLPPASSMVTVGCVPKAVPPVAPAGSVVNTSCAGSPTVTANGALERVNVSPASLAVRMSPVPDALMVHPLKAATPAEVVAVHPDRVPEPVVNAKVMASVSVVTVLPPVSSMVTVG